MSTRALAIAAVLAAAACHQTGTKKRAAECFAYTAPAGWTLTPSQTGADIVLLSPTPRDLAGRVLRDNFTVRFMPGDVSLDDLQAQVLAAAAKQSSVDAVVDDAARAHPDAPPVHVAAQPLTATPIKVAGHDGFRIDRRSAVMVGGSPVDSVGQTLFIKFNDDIVDVSAGYFVAGETETKPIADTFLASINFDRCR